ncbi:conserved hypothetical protein [Rhodospirillaceae bacterium LM-1]|nr:conserved hypothetical protein [Rhodospirillaceae bacterium LM-1]
MPNDEKSPMANTEIERLRAANAEMLKVLRAIDIAAAEIEATDGPADDRAMWTALYEARRFIGADSKTQPHGRPQGEG